MRRLVLGATAFLGRAAAAEALAGAAEAPEVERTGLAPERETELLAAARRPR